MNTPTSRSEPDNTKSRPRRILIWVGSVLAVLALLFVLVVFVLPSPTARYVIESQLERLGIQHEGIESVDIDLWNSRVSAGPVHFKSGDAKDGQIGEAGFDFSISALFEKRAFIQTFFLRGVDLFIERGEDGLITVNGIDLAQMAMDDETAPTDATESEQEKEPSIGAGIENFEFTDSRLVFEDYTGGSLTMDVSRLSLQGFRTWDPDDAGSFELEGTINEIELKLSGETRPMADPLTIELNSNVKGINIDRVAQFIGPTGLERQAGNIDTVVHYDYAIHSDGNVAGTVNGTYTFSDFDIATAEGENLTLQSAQLDVDLEQTFRPDSSGTATGSLKLKTSPVSLTSANGDTVEIAEIGFSADALSFDKLATRRTDDTDAQPAASAPATPSGPTPTIVDLLIGWAEALARNALEHHLEFDGQPAIVLRDGLLRVAPRDGNPGQELRFESVSANLGTVDSQTVNEGWTVTGALDAAVTGLQATSEELGSEATLAEAQFVSQAIDLKSEQANATLSFDLQSTLNGLGAKDGAGLALALQSLEVGTTGMRVVDHEQGGEITGPLAVILSAIEANVPSQESNMAISGERVSLDLSSLELAGQDAVSAGFSGRFELSGIDVKGDDTRPLSFSLATLSSDLNDVRVEPVAADGTIEGAVNTQVNDVQFSMGEGDDVFGFSTETIDTRIDRLQAQGADTPTVTLSGTTNFGGIVTTTPFAEGETAEIRVGTLAVALSELAAAGQAIRASADVKAEGISSKTSGEAPQSIEMSGLSVQGLKADLETATEIETITIDGLVAMINDGILNAGDAQDDASDAQQTKPVRIGRISISPGARIEFADRSVAPPMNMAIGLQNLSVGPVDTGAPETRTEIQLEARINDTATTSVQGWASPLKPTPDFDLSSTITAFPLPPLSPYAASAVGIVIDSGDLSAEVKAAATSGALNGQMDLVIDDLYVEPATDEQGKELESSLGVPVDFAVGILKNDQGQIDLGFPVSGTVDAPVVDYGEAIDKAISGAMASVFPTSWFGQDGKSFRIEPATFEAGKSDLTEDGTSVTDEIGQLLRKKSQLKVRVCGKATADDLVVLRGGTPAKQAAEDADENEQSAQSSANAPSTDEPIAKPSQQEVDALLALATERGKQVRAYLASTHAIEPDRIPECRTSYSIEDAKPPRVEFRM